MMDRPHSVHRIDGDDSIVSVNRDWLHFAAENDAPHLTEDAVLGRCLWEFIDDETTVSIYRALAKQVRETLTPVEVPFRCDAPGTVRAMRMKISPLPERGLEFESVVTSIQDREPARILSVLLFRSEARLRICSWCKAIETEDGWQSTERAVETMGLFRTPRLPALDHVTCDSCRGTLADEMGHDGP